MNESETVEVKLSEVCRGCLIKSDNMICFYPKCEETSHLIAQLSSVANCEIEINEILPNYICKLCEEKLRLCYEFKSLIQRSNEIIQQCLNDYNHDETLLKNVIEEEVKESVMEEEEEEDEEIKECLMKEEDYEEEEINDNNYEETQNYLFGKTTFKQKLRQIQFDSVEVEKAIKNAQKSFFTNNKCIECGFIGKHLRALSVHMTRLHRELKENWCAICNSRVDDLKTHKHEKFKCKFCGKCFDSSKGHFIEHLRGHSNRRPFQCKICDKSFISSRHLSNHLRIHANDRPFKCQHCPKNFVSAMYLKTHLKEHKSIVCNENNQSNEVPSRNFCKLCSKRVRSITEHEESFHRNRPKPKPQKDPALCTECGKQFKSISKLNVHMRAHTGELPYKCSHCGKRFASRTQVICHERTHTGEKPYVCYYCGKAFNQSSVLKTHMRMHTGRPECCKLCNKRFCRPAHLRLHMRKHTGEKPYECNVCDLAFKQKSHLAEHVKTHSAERPYKCTYCDKGFKQSSSLKSHVLIHLGKKPFKCTQCSYACRQSHSLTQHMKIHNVDTPREEKPYICSICDKNFSTVAMLKSHVNVNHENASIEENKQHLTD